MKCPLEGFIRTLEAQREPVAEFDSQLWASMVECVTVEVNSSMTVVKPYPLSRTVSKSRTPCFRQFNNPGTFKMDVW